MNINNDEEGIDFFNGLLERLPQAGFDNCCSHLSLVYVAPGAQHIERVDNLNFYGDTYPKPKKPLKAEDPSASPQPLPAMLRTPEAMTLWKKAQSMGYVDANYQPLISRTQAALLADAMAKSLGIEEKWKVFEVLWNRKNMYRDYYKALNLKRSLAFQDEIKRLLR